MNQPLLSLAICLAPLAADGFVVSPRTASLPALQRGRQEVLFVTGGNYDYDNYDNYDDYDYDYEDDYRREQGRVDSFRDSMFRQQEWTPGSVWNTLLTTPTPGSYNIPLIVPLVLVPAALFVLPFNDNVRITFGILVAIEVVLEATVGIPALRRFAEEPFPGLDGVPVGYPIILAAAGLGLPMPVNLAFLAFFAGFWVLAQGDRDPTAPRNLTALAGAIISTSLAKAMLLATDFTKKINVGGSATAAATTAAKTAAKGTAATSASPGGIPPELMQAIPFLVVGAIIFVFVSNQKEEQGGFGQTTNRFQGPNDQGYNGNVQPWVPGAGGPGGPGQPGGGFGGAMGGVQGGPGQPPGAAFGGPANGNNNQFGQQQGGSPGAFGVNNNNNQFGQPGQSFQQPQQPNPQDQSWQQGESSMNPQQQQQNGGWDNNGNNAPMGF